MGDSQAELLPPSAPEGHVPGKGGLASAQRRGHLALLGFGGGVQAPEDLVQALRALDQFSGISAVRWP